MAGTAFSVDMPIRFSHSDPAGIVYYPNYFDMFNSVIEDWFSEALGIDYPTQIGEFRRGFPTVHGWVFDLHDGLIKDLKIDFKKALEDIQQIYNLTDGELF